MFGANPYQIADANRIEARRWRERTQVDPMVGMNRLDIGSLPDRGWDSFFGALQRKQGDAAAAGQRFNVDLIGRGAGTGTGIGRFKAQPVGGSIYDLDAGDLPPGVQSRAVRGLSRAIGQR